ncbi:hypothetical protein REC12_20780 [Desulfosporosinus sp. PR]|uniref:hypothetical protein n=1 Tax=Candidatus Desulfosporosinus nitrosoreducens TaxID=3401928 RepID=UPI0027E6B3C5|nr:hypothetical protein [Desulfosporosinus sp. PR]MDQ7096035.1 hypothetical protein [Desulfosporosinus sp. PR]
MVFPRALQSGRISWWFVSTAVLIFVGAFWPSIIKVKLRPKKYSQTNNNAETRNNQEIIEQIKVNPINPEDKDGAVAKEIVDLESTEVLETVKILDGIDAEDVAVDNEEEEPCILEGSRELLSIDELLELGFKEKYAENFAQAAAYFLQALALEPEPDTAFYLILDCHWLGKNIGESDRLLPQIMVYAHNYFSQFSADLQRQFEVWLSKEDLDKYFK